MSATPEPGQGGVGGAGGLADAALVRLQGADAREAIASLVLANAADKLDLEPPTFPGPVAEAYYWSDADIVGIQGPVGSGKTTTKNKRKLRRAAMAPFSVIDGVRRYKVIYVRETYRQLWSTTIPSYLEVFPRALGEWSGGRGDPVRHLIRFDDGNGPIEFDVQFMAFGDNIIASMRGLQCSDLDLNEADTMAFDVVGVGIGRIDRHPPGEHRKGLPPETASWGCIDCDFNAPDEDNWTYKVFHDEAARTEILADLNAGQPEGARPISIEFFNQPGFGQEGCENLQNLRAGYYERQIGANKLGGRGDLNARLVYNRVTYLQAGEPVFKDEFNRDIHVSRTPLVPDGSRPLWIGLDQGFKGAAVIAQFRPPFHWRIHGELFFPKERLLAHTFGLRLAELLERRWPQLDVEAGWGDMAGEAGSSLAADENANWNRQVSMAAGFVIRPQRIAANRITPRLEAVRAPLEFMEGGQPGLIIDPSCKFLIRGFAARYVWADTVSPSGEKRKVPDKSVPEANPMDALQYLLLSQHQGNGLSPYSFPGLSRALKAREPRGPGSPLRGPGDAPGLTTAYDVLNPYGD